MNISPKKIFAFGISLTVAASCLLLLSEIDSYRFFNRILIFKSDQGVVKILLLVGILMLLYAETLHILGKK